MSADVDIAVMEQELRISSAETAKKQIALRMAQRERDNGRDREHIALQDAEIKKSQAEIERLRKL